jgi:hypothetical protein
MEVVMQLEPTVFAQTRWELWVLELLKVVNKVIPICLVLHQDQYGKLNLMQLGIQRLTLTTFKSQISNLLQQHVAQSNQPLQLIPLKRIRFQSIRWMRLNSPMWITTHLFTFRILQKNGQILMTVGSGLALLPQMSFITLKMPSLKSRMVQLRYLPSGLLVRVNRAFKSFQTLLRLLKVTRIQHSIQCGMLGLWEILRR